MKRVLMVLTSHRLDCLKLCLDLLHQTNSLAQFDHVVLLMNGPSQRHRHYVESFMLRHPDVPWDTIAGPRGRGVRISGLQNQCVERYPGCLYFKIDEDTFISRGWVDKLTDIHAQIAHDSDRSLVTPVIPNNAAGFNYLMNTYPEYREEYERLFPYPISSDCESTVWKYPQVAAWAMRKFIAMDEANERLERHPPPCYETFSKRFSINCIVYDYDHWNMIGGVPTDDEIGWGEWITANHKFVALATNTLVHHYSFFVQQQWLDRSSLLEELRRANVPHSLPSTCAIRYHLPRFQRIAQQVPGALKRRLGLNS